MTNSLTRRVAEHRDGEVKGFTKRYRLTRLVFYERFHYVDDAIAREKQLKRWSRPKKEKLIATINPKWIDLAVHDLGFESLV